MVELSSESGCTYLQVQNGSSVWSVLQRIGKERISRCLCPAELVDNRDKVHLDSGFGEKLDDTTASRSDKIDRGDDVRGGDLMIDPSERRGRTTHAYCHRVVRVGVESGIRMDISIR